MIVSLLSAVIIAISIIGHSSFYFFGSIQIVSVASERSVQGTSPDGHLLVNGSTLI